MAQRMNKRQSKAKQAELGLQYTCTALYIRVSTTKQADEGYSLEAQRSELDKYCEANGWNVCPGHIYVDRGVSGKSTDRPQFQQMMGAAKDGKVQRIVATKLDRIARNLKDLLQTVDELKAYGCALVVKKEQFDTSTAQGVFVLQMLGAVGELERSMIAERVQSGRVEKATQGGYNGSRCPLGYAYAGETFTVIEDQAAAVRNVFTLFLAGQSLNAIAQAMNEAQAPTASGGKWYASTVRYILTNGLYAGLAQWYADADKETSKITVAKVTRKDEDDNEYETTPYPAIISPATYEQAHKRLQALRPGKQLESEIERRLQAR